MPRESFVVKFRKVCQQINKENGSPMKLKDRQELLRRMKAEEGLR